MTENYSNVYVTCDPDSASVASSLDDCIIGGGGPNPPLPALDACDCACAPDPRRGPLKKACLRASCAEERHCGFQDSRASRKETVRAEEREPRTWKEESVMFNQNHTRDHCATKM